MWFSHSFRVSQFLTAMFVVAWLWGAWGSLRTLEFQDFNGTPMACMQGRWAGSKDAVASSEGPLNIDNDICYDMLSWMIWGFFF